MCDSTRPKAFRSALVALAWTSRLQRRSKVRSPSQSIGRGSLVFPAVLHGLRPSPVGTFEDLQMGHSRCRSNEMPPSCPSRRVQRALTFAEASRSAEAPCSCLSWGSSRPSAVLPGRVHSRWCLGRRESSLDLHLRVDGTTRRLPFRPRGLAPPRRLPPRARSRACCISLPAMGFAAFSDFPCPIAPEDARNTVVVLATHTPFEESPSPSAVPRHRGRCLPAVSTRVRPASNDLSILASWPVRSKSDGTKRIPREREPANGRMHVPEGPIDEAPIPRRTGGPPRHRVRTP
jgi:hypothetical protein